MRVYPFTPNQTCWSETDAMTDPNRNCVADPEALTLLRLFITQSVLMQEVIARSEQLLIYVQTLETALEQKNQQLAVESQLRQQAEEKFARTFHSSPSPIGIVTFSEGRFVDVNESFCRVFGYDRANVVNRTALELGIWVNPEERQILRHCLQQAGTVYDLECHARTKFGNVRTLLLSAEQIELDGVSCILFTMSDITERKHIEADRERNETEIQRLNQELRRRVTELQTILDVTPVGIAIAEDPACEMIYANAYCQNLLQIAPNTNISKTAVSTKPLSYRMFHQGKEIPNDELPMQAAAARGIEIQNFEFQILRGDGTLFDLLGHVRPLRDEQNRVRGCVATFVDITERKLAENALRATEQRFRALIQDLQVGVILQGAQSEILLSNRMAQELLGLSETELLKKSSLSPEWQVVHEDGTPFPGELHPVPQAIATRQPVRNVVMGVAHPTGERVWILVNAEPQLGCDGTVHQVICTFSDITDRKRIEEQLRYNERLLSQTQKIAQVGGWEINVETQEVTWTEQTYQPYELPVGQLPPLQDLIAFYTPEYRPLVNRAVQAAITQGEPFDLEAQLITAKGNLVWMRVIGQPYYHNGHLIRVSGSCQNVSDRKQVEALLRQAKEAADAANRAKTEFLANMSHELRTPLTSIIGLSEVLYEGAFGNLNARQQKYVAIICQSGKHLLNLINELLDLAKIEAGKMEIQLAPTSLQDLCEASLSLVQSQAQQKRISLDLEISNHLESVLLDEQRVRQVLINLLSNAIKFTPNGGSVVVQVRVDHAEAMLHISVTDTGIGIAAIDMDKLFQPFVQLDSSHSRHYGGTGLGLALVKRLVNLHNGSIALSSEIDRGSCFTVSLPLKLAPLPGQNQ
jgi:PAS domain S-box-containing protein